MLLSVVDFGGLNRFGRTVLAKAANAMIGMVKGPARQVSSVGLAGGKPLVTATMFGVTTPCVEAARGIMESNEYEVLVFHATGVGGQTMEAFVRDGLVTGVLDITTTEL